MSEDEILDEALYHDDQTVIDVLENVFIFKNTNDKFTKLDLECIHDLLDLYKQEKEKNKSLQKQVTMMKDYYKNADIIFKDKIKEKIEEIEKRRLEDGEVH